MNIEIEHINGFILPSEKDMKVKLKEFKSSGIILEIKCFAGYLSRRSHVLVKYKNIEKCELLNYKEANELFMSWAKNIFGENKEEYQILSKYKSNIEDLDDYINYLGTELIKDYNYKYYYLKQDEIYYNNTSQKCLIKLEQLFILYNLDSCRIDEFAKPSAPLFYGRNVFNWIEKITELKVDKVNLLKDYLDEYFQYLLGKPKCIWSINNISLPLKEFERNHMSISQYASYLNRKSIVHITLLNKSQLCSNKIANDSFLTWFKSIFGEYSSESMQLESYRNKIENLSEKIIKLGKKLIDNYDDEKKFSEKQQCLINLEQLLIRYDLPSQYVYVSNKKGCIDKEKKYIVNDTAIDWINKITNKNEQKLKDLNFYLDEYLYYIIERPKSENANNKVRKGFGKLLIFK